ncbi:phosphatidylethanolamine-binding protein 1-like isoform X3 [Pieris napi]|uniref:phosphatidylethanolamine-binding protein 1-like isoform X3 n=1 Tax=Pieris napi TaxID=78633 RepID=UPI001FB8DE41|nr:phosphatidylethanolamine-binding protein 1-like isoform X3 [Pieris napi]
MRVLISLLFVYGVLGDEPCSISCISGNLTAPMEPSAPEAFKKYGLTPKYVPIAPKDQLMGTFLTANVGLGNFIDPLRIIDSVNIKYPNGKDDVKYTLFMLDFDAPRSHQPNVYIIGLYVNAPSSNLITDSDHVVTYVPPLPGLGTGTHRPTALLYEQNEHIDPEQPELTKLLKTRVFQVEQFVKKYNLKAEPAAGNFFTTSLSRCGDV